MKTELNTRIEKYSVMAAAAGAATVGLSASAAIITSGPQNVVINAGNSGTAFDLDGDTFNDVAFTVGTFGGQPLLQVNALYASDGPAVATSGAGYPYAVNFAAGSVIDSTASFNAGGGGTMIYSGFGNFQAPNNSGFVGYTFAAGVGQVFGWIEVANVTDTELTVVQWAFEDTGAAIQAGAVPEPGSLALLALGAVGVMSRRSRKAVRDAA